MLTFHVIPLFLVIASEAWNLKVCACAMILDSSLRSATFRMTECQHCLARYVNVRQSGARVARCVRSSRRGTPRRVRLETWRFAVVGAGFEEVELLDASGWIVLLDAVDYGGPQRSSGGPVSRRVWLGWRSLPSTREGLDWFGTRADPRERGPPCAGGHGRLAEAGACRSS